MATERGMPARSRFLTAVRLKSCRMRPGTPAAVHACCHAFRNLLRGRPRFVRWYTHEMMLPVLCCFVSVTVRRASVEKAAKLLGFRSQVDIEDGLRRLVAWRAAVKARQSEIEVGQS